MTNLSQRIMDAWLDANNPKDTGKQLGEWYKDRNHLQTMLNCGAYESAVIQFLKPVGWAKVHFGKGAMATLGSYGEWTPTVKDIGGACFTEALLNAILAAREV